MSKTKRDKNAWWKNIEADGHFENHRQPHELRSRSGYKLRKKYKEQRTGEKYIPSIEENKND